MLVFCEIWTFCNLVFQIFLKIYLAFFATTFLMKWRLVLCENYRYTFYCFCKFRSTILLLLTIVIFCFFGRLTLIWYATFCQTGLSISNQKSELRQVAIGKLESWRWKSERLKQTGSANFSNKDVQILDWIQIAESMVRINVKTSLFETFNHRSQRYFGIFPLIWRIFWILINKICFIFCWQISNQISLTCPLVFENYLNLNLIQFSGTFQRVLTIGLILNIWIHFVFSIGMFER